MTHTLITYGACMAMLLGGASAAQAHGDAQPPAAAYDATQVEARPYGREGDPARVTRVVRLGMNDQFRYTPAAVTVRRGETVRFIVRNHGKLLHEVVLGTPDELKAHAEMMRKHPGMEHADANMAHVRPGARGEIVWQFTEPGVFQFACLLPGHFEAGMVGTITVK